MKYLFIDTSALVVSCISTRSEHKIESFNVLKERLKKNEVKLLLPEVVRIEFERNIETLSNMIKDAINNLEKIVMKSKIYDLPILEEEKLKLSKTLKDISKAKEKRLDGMLKEIQELFYYDNVQNIFLNGEIFVKAYIRCHKREKPFKVRDGNKLNDEIDLVFESSILNDTLIVESLVSACSGLNKSTDVLIFCSDNIYDFADVDEKTKKHYLHPEISKDIPVKVKYYRYLPELLRIEFKTEVVKERKDEQITLSDLLKGKYDESLRTFEAWGEPMKKVAESILHDEERRGHVFKNLGMSVMNSLMQEGENRRKLMESFGLPNQSVIESLIQEEENRRKLMESFRLSSPSKNIDDQKKGEEISDKKNE